MKSSQFLHIFYVFGAGFIPNEIFVIAGAINLNSPLSLSNICSRFPSNFIHYQKMYLEQPLFIINLI